MTRAAIYIAAAFAALVGLMTVDAQTHTQPATETTVATSDEPLAVRHAQAAAELASVELAIAEQLNARVPAAVPASEVDWLETNARLAQQRMEMTQSMNSGAGPSMQAAFADEMAKYAQREYEASLQNGVPEASVLADLKLERQRLKAEVAQLRAEMWREHSYEPLLVEQLQWQIDRLAEEVVELNHRVQELE